MSTRRSFIQKTLGATAAISLGSPLPRILLGASREAEKAAGERILVVVQLSGGNDGLNTVVPYGDDEYYKNRFTLAIDRQAVRKVDDQIGLHPSLAGLHGLLENQQLAIVQGVGYPNPNRSHFESMDLWHTAHRIEEARLGWLGRVVDNWGQAASLPALHFGAEFQPLALRAEEQSIPSVRSIDNFQLNAFRDASTRRALEPLLKRGPVDSRNELLGYIHENTALALETSARLEKVSSTRRDRFAYPNSSLGRNLRSVAQLIGSGLSTRIYYTALNGFDTHSNQAAAHAGLLTDLDNSVSAFMKEIADQGNADRVTLFAFSEFGRRLRENASAGTDHGAAAPVFLVGAKVKPGLVGEHPSMTDLDQGDLKYQIDYRSVYAGVLKNWLGVEPASIVGDPFRPCELFST